MAGDKLELSGTVLAARGNGMFLVSLDTQQTLLCRLSGKIRKNKINILEGDYVKIEVSPYDLEKGIIVYRGK